MKLLVLGGCGEVGSAVTEDIVRFGHFDVLTIADIDLAKAETYAASFNDPRVRSARVDVKDHQCTVDLMRSHEAVMNCLFHGLFHQVFPAVLEAGIDYADLISEPSEKHYRQALEVGITAISGLGATPGLTNVLAAKAAESLDRVEEIQIHWFSSRSMAPSLGLLDTILWELSPYCPTRVYYQNGKFISAKPFEGGRTVRFAEPIGEQFVYYVPHTEVYSLARHYPSANVVSVRGSWRPEIMESVKTLNKLGLLNEEIFDTPHGRMSAREATRLSLWRALGGKRDQNLWGFFLNVEVSGERNGREETIIFNVSHPTEWNEKSTSRMTGYLASIGFLLMLKNGRIKKGLLDPEAYYNPDEFLLELQKRSIVFEQA